MTSSKADELVVSSRNNHRGIRAATAGPPVYRKPQDCWTGWSWKPERDKALRAKEQLAREQDEKR